MKTGRRDAYDCERHAIQLYGLADTAGITIESSPPEGMAQDHDRVPARDNVFLRQKETTEKGTHAQNRKIVVGNDVRLNLYRQFAISQVSAKVAGQSGEHRVTVAVVSIVGITDFRRVRLASWYFKLANSDDLLWSTTCRPSIEE